MKKAFTVIAALVTVLVAYSGVVFWAANENVVAADPKVRLYLSPATSSIATGSITSLQIRLSKNTNSKVDYVNADLTFSASSLEVTSIAKQGSHFSASGGPTTSYNNTSGTVSVKGTGAELPTTADVLVATVTFKGKVAGTTSISFTAASQAGDITNGGHVNDALDMKTGGAITVSTPPKTTAPVSKITPSTTPTSTPPPDEPSTTPTSTPTDDESSPQSADDVDEEVAPVVVAEPFWRKYLWPITGGALLITGAAATAVTLVMKRRSSNQTDAAVSPVEDEEDLVLEAEPTATPESTVKENSSIEDEEVLAEKETVSIPLSDPAKVVNTAPIAAAAPTKPIPKPPTPPPTPTPTSLLARPVQTVHPEPRPAASLAPIRNTTDYANLPDMFDLGEKRLQDEGLGDMKPTVPK